MKADLHNQVALTIMRAENGFLIRESPGMDRCTAETLWISSDDTADLMVVLADVIEPGTAPR